MKNLSHLFTRPIVYQNRRIARPLYFYVSLNKIGRVATERLITKHGGKTVSNPGNPGSHIISLIDPLSKPPLKGYAVHSIEYVQSCIDAGRLLELEDFRVSHRNDLSPRKNAASSHLTPSRQKNVTKATYTPLRGFHINQNIHGKPDEKYIEDSDEKGNTPGNRKRRRQAYYNENSRKKIRVSARRGPYDSQPKSYEKDYDAMEPVTDANGVNGPRDGSTEIVKRKVKRERNEFQTPSPVHAGHRWTATEDAKLIRLCAAVRRAFPKTKASASKVFITETWESLEKKGLLPENRGAEECCQRAMKLQGPRSRELQNRRVLEEEPNNYVVRRPLTTPSDIDEDEIEPIHSNTKGKSHAPHPKQRTEALRPKERAEAPQPIQNHPNPNQKHESLGRQVEKKARAHKAKDFIRRNVRLLSSETKMTQRRVFQVLRSKSGDVAEAREALLRERLEIGQVKRRRHSML